MGKASLILVEDLRLNVAKDNDSDTSSANNCGNKGEDDEVSEVGERSVPSYSPNKKGKVSLTLLGRVEVDDRETIEIDYDDYVEQ